LNPFSDTINIRSAIRLIGDDSLTNGLDSLQNRRSVADLTIFYKYLMDESVSNEIHTILPPYKTYKRSTREASAAYPYAVLISQCRTKSFQQDYFNRVAPLWNNLPRTVFPNSFNVQAFKTNVHIELSKC
jgi:hypothetical protein